MTVATEACYAERQYTGVETAFSPGFAAQSPDHVTCGYFDASGMPVNLTRGVHFSVALDPAGNVTVTRIAFPSASPASPVTIFMERVTPAVQGVDFINLAQFDPAVHETIADAGAMRDAELRAQMARVVQPFNASSTAIDYRPLNVRAADPLVDADVATRGWVLQVTGLINIAASVAAAAASAAAAAVSAALAATRQTAAEAAQNLAQLWASQAVDTPVTTGPNLYSAFHWASKAAASAATVLAALGAVDYGFVAASSTETRDYGTIP